MIWGYPGHMLLPMAPLRLLMGFPLGSSSGKVLHWQAGQDLHGYLVLLAQVGKRSPVMFMGLDYSFICTSVYARDAIYLYPATDWSWGGKASVSPLSCAVWACLVQLMRRARPRFTYTFSLTVQSAAFNRLLGHCCLQLAPWRPVPQQGFSLQDRITSPVVHGSS